MSRNVDVNGTKMVIGMIIYGAAIALVMKWIFS